MKKPVTKYALREIVKNGTIHPHIVFTVTTQEIADLSHIILRNRPVLVVATADAPDTMTVMGLNKPTSADSGFKAKKDITLAYKIFAKRAMKHNHTVKVWVWNEAPGDCKGVPEYDNFMTQPRYNSPDEILSFAPRDFRKNQRVPAAEAAQKFYERIRAPKNLNEEAPSGCTILKIFSTAR